jgi:predicted nucleic acid-binding protein
MSIIYLDTSALIKRYVHEIGSEALMASWSMFDITGSAIIVYTEMGAALSKAVRLGWQSESDAQAAWQMFQQDWAQLTLIRIDLAVIYRSGDLAWQYGLRGYDALHLAAALIWQDGMGQKITFATYDKQLWEAAQSTSLEIFPAKL